MKQEAHLELFLNPRSIAVFGSMTEEWFFGPGVIIKDLLAWDYTGTIYPIHPEAEKVYRLDVRHDIADIGEPIDLAVIITSCRRVPELLEKCGRQGVRAAIVVADGFGETGPEGMRRQEELLRIARSHGMRLIGPNTLGTLNTADRFTSIPYEKGYEYARTGPLSIITQTGMYGPQAIALNEYGFGVNKIIDLGNMCDIDEVDCLEYLETDPGTEVISLYLEHTRRPRELLETARRVSLRKPIICLKGGKTSAAAEAMASHTGSMAADDRLYGALFSQSGIIRVEEYRDLLDHAAPFVFQPLPGGNRLGIITFSGAIGIQCVDAAESVGLSVGSLSGESREKLRATHRLLTGHPIDLGPASAVAGPEVFSFYEKSFEVMMEDQGIDCVYLNAYVNEILRPDFYRNLLTRMRDNSGKPVTMWAYGTSERLIHELGVLAGEHGIPFFSTTQKAIQALGNLNRYARWRRARMGEESSPAQ
ncbi:MAG: CoA-binding protein [Deltaproteobacteria bacterium]|nr:CoA-binding protein [Deltaproteobacteria bacterium]